MNERIGGIAGRVWTFLGEEVSLPIDPLAGSLEEDPLPAILAVGGLRGKTRFSSARPGVPRTRS